MSVFSVESLKQLATCDPELQILFNEVIQYMDCRVTEGFRNEVDQNAAVAAGNSKLPWPKGKHNNNPSDAADVYPFPIDIDAIRREDKKVIQRLYYFSGFVCGIANKLKDEGRMTRAIRWGGAWDGLDELNTPKMLNDLVHFELV